MGQNQCIIEEQSGYSDYIDNLLSNAPVQVADTQRIIKINIHFFLRNNGTGNFTETHDNAGNPLSGYEFAKNMVDEMNKI